MARKPTAIQVVPKAQLPVSSAAGDRAYLSYLKELDPRGNEDLQIAMGSSKDPRFLEFLERINMPKYSKVGLVTIAKGCNISLTDFSNWWQKESHQRAIARAQLGSVNITRDLVEDAKSVMALCPRCDGLKFVPAQEGLPEGTDGYRMVVEAKGAEPAKYIRDCPNCMAEGRIRKPGDQHARDKVLDIAGLVKKGAAVQITQNFSGASQSSALDNLKVLDITAEEI